MGVYDYKNFGTADSKALFSDAMAITLYSYHNLDNGFAAGYQHNGFGLGLPATLVTALLAWSRWLAGRRWAAAGNLLRAIAAQMRLRRGRALDFDPDRMLELAATAFALPASQIL